MYLKKIREIDLFHEEKAILAEHFLNALYTANAKDSEVIKKVHGFWVM